MNAADFSALVQDLVAQAKQLSEKHTAERNAPVNYACVFAQSENEYEALLDATQQLGGSIVKETTMGPVFKISPITTAAGDLGLVKIRRPDPKRPERGDADFTVSDYPHFKKTHLGRPGFSLITREDFEMIELIDPAFNVLAYYSHPTLTEVLGLE